MLDLVECSKNATVSAVFGGLAGALTGALSSWALYRYQRRHTVADARKASLRDKAEPLTTEITRAIATLQRMEPTQDAGGFLACRLDPLRNAAGLIHGLLERADRDAIARDIDALDPHGQPRDSQSALQQARDLQRTLDRLLRP